MGKIRRKPTHIYKRDGRLVPLRSGLIETAIKKALRATNTGDGVLAADLCDRVVKNIGERFIGSIPGVEDVQDIVEEVLMAGGYRDAARAYILYRKKRSNIRSIKKFSGVEDDLKLSVNATRVMERRYLQRDEYGNVVETPGGLFRRVADAVSRVETKFDPSANIAQISDEFYNLMAGLEFLPNSPTLMNAGTELGQLSACFVLPIEDSVGSIFDALKNTAIIHQSGGGTGFSFRRIRPKGDMVRSTKGIASGPVSFMEIFDTATGVMKQGGRRRGANMGILNVEHPDIYEFIAAKSKEGAFRNFNISVAVTDSFMEAVRKGRNWKLVNPRSGAQTSVVKAREVFDMIVNNAWNSGEPGMIFIDSINRFNPTPQLGSIEATNPCGEIPLLPYESCNLGSINLSRMVSGGRIDWERLGRVTDIAVRFLDDVIEANNFPLPDIERMTKGNRKIGLGVMGFADVLAELEIPYDSGEGLEVAEKIAVFILERAAEASNKLARERGKFPNFKGSIHQNAAPEGIRNASLVSIAPTGTISIIADCSSGIEPIFALAYVRNAMEGNSLIEINRVFERKAREYGFYSHELIEKASRKGTIREVDGIPQRLKRIFATDYDIKPEWHVRMQAAFQKYTDNSVAKTVNLPEEATVDDIRKVYRLAHSLGCKGITVYRYGSRREQVLYRGRHILRSIEANRYVTTDMEYGGGCISGNCSL
ncbi:MAG: adenosylcobalamin-dependent ribonucleoside-diphosphate reductase [Dehalococcoidales bacterium]